MKSVKFFSCLVSCGIFLAAPSFAMENHHKHRCGCRRLIHKEFVQSDIREKVIKLMRSYFFKDVSKIKLFKNYFNSINFSDHPLVYVDDSTINPIIDEILETNKKNFQMESSDEESSDEESSDEKLSDVKFSKEEQKYLNKENFSTEFLSEVCFFIHTCHENNKYYYVLRACCKGNFQPEENEPISNSRLNLICIGGNKYIFQVNINDINN